MAKIKVGIVGYGNLGRGVERAIVASENHELVRIFSKRPGLSSPLNSKFELTENLEKYAGKIDILFLCGGSYSDIEVIGPRAIKLFNTVDSFDTHAKLDKYITDLDKLAKQSEKIAVSACGWDPGLFSLMRLVFNAVSPANSPANTFWGKGVSQGHSDAIRRIEGVKNAIQYTVPNEKEVKNCTTKVNYVPENSNKHFRECYVVLEEGADANKIKEEIVNMPNYFKGYKTSVKFVSEEKLKKMQEKMYHRGEIIKHYPSALSENNSRLKFTLDLDSNPSFTAEMMVCCSNAIVNFKKEKKYGAYSIFDIPPIALSLENRNELIKKYL